MSPLSSEERRELLAIARKAITESIEQGTKWRPSHASAALQDGAGAFVTLRIRNRLRGCVGNPFTLDPLSETVARCAVLAAKSDQRFSSVTADEVRDLEIEISVLSPMTRLSAESIEVGKHGLLIERGRAHGLLLPQVATEHHLSRERFLEETCEKAGLPRDAWKLPDATIYGFTAEIFREADFPAGLHAAVKP